MFGNPFEVEGKWYKCALHVHTTDSDGEFSPLDTVKVYAREEFDIVCLTDHQGSAKLPEPVSGIRVFPGAEVTAFEKLHIVVLGAEEPKIYEDNQAEVEALIERGRNGEIALILAHPCWSHLRLSDMMAMEGISAVEVYNTCCDIEKGRGFSEAHLDELLDVRGSMWGVAADDLHYACHIGRGWTMIKLAEPTPECLAKAIQNGWFYSSNGINIHELDIRNNQIHLVCDPVARINFIGGPDAGLGKCFYSANGSSLVEIDYELSKEYTGYLRIECLAADGRRAWSNPFKFENGNIGTWPMKPSEWKPAEPKAV